ncbi:type II toxin-antitoxin system RelE/ParE family toxin [Georgenia sp. H159]|uniref:type II toxin-antitoxin system RelE/ParE family toxin n=1 Tax=Georgenia sp. H159 TaxID=3076115 RepID=UPI002D785E0B|nr:type II toxin-antitoxin system RelE/ParE family toxin [Georgenia sp. H159]
MRSSALASSAISRRSGTSLEERWDVDHAERYIAEIRAAIERVADDPRRGRACDEIREGCHRYGIGSHLLFYVESPEGVDVVRILHRWMDPTLRL